MTTAPAALLLAAVCGTGDAATPDGPPPAAGLAPVVRSVLHDVSVLKPPPAVVRGQSPGAWVPTAPVGPGFGGPGFGNPGFGGPAYAPPPSRPPGGFGGPGPRNPVGPEFAAPGIARSYGVNGPQPYDFAPEFRFDAGYLFPAGLDGRDADFAVTELDFRYEIDSPGPLGEVITVAPLYEARLLDGYDADPAAGQPPLPGALHRLGIDFALTTPKLNGFSGTVGFTPAFASDFDGDLTELGRQYDGRAALFYDAAPDLTLVAGVKYYDRSDDLLLPWVGAVWRPGDRWEIRAVFPEPRVEYFWGPVWGKPMWVYAEAGFQRESWEFTPGGGGFPSLADLPDLILRGGELPETGQVQFDDLRFVVGARKEQGWGKTFLEAGVVFDRSITFRETPGANTEVGESLILRGGVRF